MEKSRLGFCVLLLGSILFIYGAYKSYIIQKEQYKTNIALRLLGTCGHLIRHDFKQHASLFEYHSKTNSNFGIKSNFTIYNNLLDLQVFGYSTLYFNDFAPQEITCMAYLQTNRSNRKITENTKVNFYIGMPFFLPGNYDSYLANHSFLTLTFAQMEEIAPIIKLTPLEKPKYSVFSYFYKKLGEWL